RFSRGALVPIFGHRKPVGKHSNADAPNLARLSGARVSPPRLIDWVFYAGHPPLSPLTSPRAAADLVKLLLGELDVLSLTGRGLAALRDFRSGLCRLGVIFDRRCGFRLRFDVCFSPKATYLLRGNEMTRWANSVNSLNSELQQRTTPTALPPRSTF